MAASRHSHSDPDAAYRWLRHRGDRGSSRFGSRGRGAGHTRRCGPFFGLGLVPPLVQWRRPTQPTLPGHWGTHSGWVGRVCGRSGEQFASDSRGNVDGGGCSRWSRLCDCVARPDQQGRTSARGARLGDGWLGWGRDSRCPDRSYRRCNGLCPDSWEAECRATSRIGGRCSH